MLSKSNINLFKTPKNDIFLVLRTYFICYTILDLKSIASKVKVEIKIGGKYRKKV